MVSKQNKDKIMWFINTFPFGRKCKKDIASMRTQITPQQNSLWLFSTGLLTVHKRTENSNGMTVLSHKLYDSVIILLFSPNVLKSPANVWW